MSPRPAWSRRSLSAVSLICEAYSSIPGGGWAGRSGVASGGSGSVIASNWVRGSGSVGMDNSDEDEIRTQHHFTSQDNKRSPQGGSPVRPTCYTIPHPLRAHLTESEP